MTENDFYIRLWALAAMVASVTIFATAGYYAHKTNVIANSDNPLELSCALDGDTYSLKTACVTLTAIKGHNK